MHGTTVISELGAAPSRTFQSALVASVATACAQLALLETRT